MSKPRTPLTIATRKLYDQDPTITYRKAIPLLRELGIPVVDASSEPVGFDVWDKYTVKMNDHELVQVTLDECGFDAKTRKLVHAHAIFKHEQNLFNCAKSNYKTFLDSGKPTISEKPPVAKNVKSRIAAKVQLRKDVEGAPDVLGVIQKMGGLSKCKETIAQMNERTEKVRASIEKRRDRIVADEEFIAQQEERVSEMEAESDDLQGQVQSFKDIMKAMKAAA